jgi:hypothetical protein
VLQDRIHEHADEFLELMASDDCIFYFCGLKRMYTSVLDMLEVRLSFVRLLLRVQCLNPFCALDSSAIKGMYTSVLDMLEVRLSCLTLLAVYTGNNMGGGGNYKYKLSPQSGTLNNVSHVAVKGLRSCAH